MSVKRIYSGSTAEERGRLLHNSSEESQTTSASPAQSTCFKDGARNMPSVRGKPENCAEYEITHLDKSKITDKSHTLPRIKNSRSDSHKVKKSKSKSSTLSGATHKSSSTRQVPVGESKQVASPGETEKGRLSSSRRKKSPESGSASRGRASPGRSQQQKVVYYQNRFITIPIDGATARADSGSSGKASASEQSGAGSSSNKAEVGRSTDSGPGQPTRQKDGAKTGSSKMAGPGLDSTSINMQPIDMDNTPSEEPGTFMGRWRRPPLLKKVGHYLQDNRMKTGDPETQEKLRTLNKTQESSNPILKKILNIIFVTTGVSLLFAVVVVIIYTSIVTDNPTAPKEEAVADKDRLGRDLSLAVGLENAASKPEDLMRLAASRQQQHTTPPQFLATPSPEYKVIPIDEMDDNDYEERQTKVETNDDLIPLNRHDYDGQPYPELPGSERDTDFVDQDWRPVNSREDDDSDIVSRKNGGYGYSEVNKNKKDNEKDRTQDRPPKQRPKGNVSLGYVTVTSTTVDPFDLIPPKNAIIDEFGVRETEYIHNYKVDNVRHHKKKQEGRKLRGKLRESRTRLHRQRPSSST